MVSLRGYIIEEFDLTQLVKDVPAVEMAYNPLNDVIFRVFRDTHRREVLKSGAAVTKGFFDFSLNVQLS